MPFPQIPLPQPPTGSRRIADWLRYLGEWVMLQSGQTLASSAGGHLGDWIEKRMGITPEIEAPSSEPVLDYLLNLEGMPPEITEAIRSTAGKESVDRVAMGVLFSALGFAGMIGGPTSVVSRAQSYEADKRFRSARPAPEYLWAMIRRLPEKWETFQTYLEETGWSDDLITAWQEITRPLLDNRDLATAYLRGHMTPDEFNQAISKKGYSDRDRDIIDKLTQVIPPVQDLIRMSVREAFDEQAVRQFGYDDNFPAEFGAWAEKQGLSRDWAGKYWRAHWQLPSVQLGMEMLHRREIDPATFKLLLRVSDYPTYWQDKIEAVSYSPYTRVDVRRMFEMGVLGETELLEAYLDAGYNEERAAKLTEWTIKEYGHGQESKMINAVLAALQYGTITESEARTQLEMLDVPAFQIDSDLALAQFKKEDRYEREVHKNIKVDFVGGMIDESQAISRLAATNPPAGFIKDQVELWKVLRARKVKKLTFAQVKKFWQNGIIDEGDVDREMSKIGYGKEYAEWFKLLWLLDMMEEEE